MTTKTIERQNSDKLVKGKALLEILFAKGNRPSLRTLARMTSSRAIPYKKIGKGVFYDPEEVRDCLDRKNTVKAVGN